MIIKIHARLNYKVEDLATVLLQIEVASMPDQRILKATTNVRDAVDFTRVPAEESVGERSWIRVKDKFVCDYRARVEIDRPEVNLTALGQAPMHELPGELIKIYRWIKIHRPRALRGICSGAVRQPSRGSAGCRDAGLDRGQHRLCARSKR